MPDQPLVDYTGRRLGNWRLGGLLGQGSFGSVYLAQNPLIDREAAVKVLHPHFSFDPAIRKRFFDEARAASLARVAEHDDRPHPGVVQIFDGDDGSGNPDGLCYIVMERLSGCTLEQTLGGGPLQPLAVARLGAALADALDAVHHRGVVHRDLKPENIFLLQGDPARPKILDFGVAKLRGDGRGTVPGTLLGSPLYMSPEQGQGLPDLDQRSDLYSLGVILFECLTAQVLFSGDNFQRVIWRHISEAPRDPRLLAPATPEPLSRLVLELLAKDPAARPTAAQVRDRLRELLPALSVPPRRPAGREGADARVWPLAVAGVTLPVLLVGAWAVLRPAADAPPGAKDRRPVPVVESAVTKGPARQPGPPPPRQPDPPPAAPAVPDKPLPPGFLSQAGVALAPAQVSISEFHAFVDKTGATRPGPDKWPWALSRPLPADWPINNIPPDLAARYCTFRYGPAARLPRRAELNRVKLPKPRLADMASDEAPRGLLGFRCALDVAAEVQAHK